MFISVAGLISVPSTPLFPFSSLKMVYKIFYSFCKLQMSTDSDCFLPEVCCLNSLASHKQSSSSERLNTISPGKDLRAANGVFVGKMVLEEKKNCIQESLGNHKLLGFWTGQHLSVFYGSIIMLHRSYSWMLCVPALSYTTIHSLAELSCGAVQTWPNSADISVC